jgi:hypothetical protein
MAEAITARGGDYVLAMKGNQPALCYLSRFFYPTLTRVGFAAPTSPAPRAGEVKSPSPVCGTFAKTSSPSRLASLAPQDEEVLGDLILRCEGEARASKGEVAHYAKVPLAGEGGPSEARRVRA